MRSEKPRRREPKPKTRLGGAIMVVEDFRGNLEAALKDNSPEAPPPLTMAWWRRTYTPNQTPGPRKW